MYRDADLSWRGGDFADLADVANKDYEDAVREVIQTRRLVDKASEKLKEYDERHLRESE